MSELVDELAGEKLPAALMDPVLERRRARHAERRAAAAAKTAAIDRIAELLHAGQLDPDALDELEQLSPVAYGEYSTAAWELRDKIRARRTQLTASQAPSDQPAGDAQPAAGDSQPEADTSTGEATAQDRGRTRASNNRTPRTSVPLLDGPLEGVRELLARSKHAVLFGDRAGRDELRRDDALVVVELGGSPTGSCCRSAALTLSGPRGRSSSSDPTIAAADLERAHARKDASSGWRSCAASRAPFAASSGQRRDHAVAARGTR